MNILSQMLRQWDATNIVSTTNPHEVLPLFRAFQPDMILLDLMMPGLDGFQVMEQLKPLIDDDDFLPILILTADASTHSKRQALMLGAADFLTKPFDSIELSLRLHNLLSRRMMHGSMKERNLTLDQQVQERTQQLARAELDTAECLAMAGEYRDDDTGQHTHRVGRMAAELARKIGRPETEIALIKRAAPLHDVGKIGIPDRILLKPDKLTPEEFNTIKTHTTIGSAIMTRHHTPLLQEAALIALHHHERWDGRGYPNGLAGEAIPLTGRIVAVADVFDALTNNRPYKKAWPVHEAVAEIENQANRQFDPEVVAAFTALMNEQKNRNLGA